MNILSELTFHAVIPAVFFFLAAAIVWPAMRARRRTLQLLIWILVVALTSLALFLLWPAPRPARAVVAVLALLWALRVYSFCREPVRRGFLHYLRFLSFAIISPYLVYSPNPTPAPRNVSKIREILRILASAIVIAIAARLGKLLISTNASVNSWLINDLYFTTAFAIIMPALGQCSFGIWQLLGLRSRPIVDNILMSRTPEEFWRRWSWPIHLWLYRYVYFPAGGNAHRIRATMAVFLVSGLQHELLVLIAIGRITGHQILFFLLNGLGVIASPAMNRFASRGVVPALLMHLTTILFMAATATLMFITFNFVFPIYWKKIWLMWPGI